MYVINRKRNIVQTLRVFLCSQFIKTSFLKKVLHDPYDRYLSEDEGRRSPKRIRRLSEERVTVWEGLHRL